QVIDAKYKKSFFTRMKRRLSAGLSHYNDPNRLYLKNVKDKVQSTFDEAYLAAKAMRVGEALRKKQRIASGDRLEPLDIEELTAFFHSKIDKEYFDVRKTIEKN